MATLSTRRVNKIEIEIWQSLGVIALFVLVLTAGRLLWLTAFQSPEQPHAVEGQLDLRQWDVTDGETLSLDGQWWFYPHELLTQPSGRFMQKDEAGSQIRVPGGWDALLAPGSGTPYGYGSYHLRILVRPESDLTYSIYVPSVRSASALYVNGKLLAKSGRVDTEAKQYEPRNVPYVASFRAGEDGIIDLVVQAANFEDPRKSGIVRSIKFGTEAAIANKMKLSLAMQLLVTVVFLLHAFYAVLLYVLGNREQRLLHFALLVLSVLLVMLLGNDEKMIHDWIPVNYAWGFKLMHLSLAGAGYALPGCLKQELSPFMRKISKAITVLTVLLVLLAVLLPVKALVTIQPAYIAMIAISVGICVHTLIRASRKEFRDRLLLLSLMAFFNHMVWWGILLATGIKLLFYPFDLILAIGCLAAVWFKRYFRMHADARMLADKLRQADKLKDEFLANTSHELRNPLHSMLNISKAVLERERHVLGRESINDMEMMLAVGQRMSLMLNDLLDVMRLRENVTRLHFRPFSLPTVARGVIDMLRYMAEGKPVRLILDIPADFPLVYADENRVIQILFNLLHNALKFTDKGEVAVRAQVLDGKVEVLVSDTGIGMDGETLKRVFEPYVRGMDAETMGEGGFGLGLGICKQLVELHGETLEASSVPGQGTQFRFTLQLAGQQGEWQVTDAEDHVETRPAHPPAIAKPVTQAAPFRPDIVKTSRQHASNRSRILIVDDDPVNLKVLESILGRDDYEIRTATGGQEALERLDEQEWDLVISDVMMPHMSGYALTQAIRQRFALAELPVLLLTARDRPEDMEAGFQSGANDYVTKPVEALELRTRVKALITVKQSVRERLHMEAAWLQAQIQPHFLFNTLNAIAALSEVDTDRMRNLLEAFGHFLKDKFRFRKMEEPVPIAEELQIVRSYLMIEQERLGDKLQFEWDVDVQKSFSVPALSIQPLVENAIRHGIMKRSGGGKVAIRVKNRHTHAEISVEDDGVGMDAHVLEQIRDGQTEGSPGVGLKNTLLRLKRQYGNGLEVTSTPGEGTRISFVVPFD